MKIKLPVFLFTLLFISRLGAQNASIPNRGCGSPILPQQFETWVQSLTPPTTAHGSGPNQTMSVFNIPVIVHVIHNGNPVNGPTATTGDNLNAAQIQSQINILNKDYNGLNADTTLIPAVFKPVQGKFQFNFCLAVVNPTGGVLAEPGIDRINATTTSFSATSAPYSMNFITSTIKPATIWDPNRYMNMWVVNMGGGVLGFATFPNPGASGLAGLSAPYGTATTDGLVMLNKAFGNIGTAASGAPYNLGRTATHEIGHWLGLRHTWGDNGQCGGTDYCNDTPPQQGGTASPAGCNYGCPTFPLHANTCTLSGQSNVNGDMFMNYMDYTDDACMNMFTKDQKYRAQLIMTNSTMRATLLTSTVCNLPSVINDIALLYVSNPTYSQAMGCTNFINPVVTVNNSGSNTITSATYSYNVDGVNTQTVAWTGTLAPNSSATVSLSPVSNLSNGSHVYNVGVYLPNGVADPNMSNNSNSQFFAVSNTFTMSIAGGNATICPSATAALTATGGATSYTWMPGNIQSNSMITTPSPVAVIYTLTGSNGLCVNTLTTLISIGAVVTASTNVSTICNLGQSATLTAYGAGTYTWDNGSNSPTIVITPTTTAIYNVFSDNGCLSNAGIAVNVGQIPTVTINASPVTTVCSGGSATLTASGANTYIWSTGFSGSVAIVNPTVSTTYSVMGMNNGCNSTQTVNVAVGSGTINLGLSVSSLSLCSGDAATLTASGATSYSWSTGDTSPVIVVHPSVTTVYSIEGSNGPCSSNVSTLIIVLPSAGNLTVTALPSYSLCIGHNTATLTAVGSQSSYVWSNPVVTSPSIVVSPSVTTSYTVSGSGSSGGACSGSSVITLYVNAGPASVLNNVNSHCSAPCTGVINATTTGGTAPYTYVIGANTYTSMPINNLCPGLYYMHVNDVNGCSELSIFSISNNPAEFPASISITNSSCDTCNNGMLHANVSTGIPPYSFTWLPAGTGGNTASISNLGYGCYTVTVRDSVGCLVNASACIGIVGIESIAGNTTVFSVYPNPAKELVTIACNGDHFDYNVYDHLGQLVLSRKNNRSSATFSPAELASGIYLVEVNNGKETARKKLIIE